MRLDASKVELPAQVLAVDIAQVGYKEGIFLAGLADLRIDTIDALLEGLANQLLGARLLDNAAMIECGGKSWSKSLDRIIGQEIVWFSLVGVKSRRCHSTSKQRAGLSGLIECAGVE